jgi:transcriptional regulator with XRE-family HTH domain
VEIMNRLAEKIRDARLKAKMTEKQLAKKCGLSPGYIMQIESGKKIINENAAEKILKALGQKAEILDDAGIVEEAKEKKPKKNVQVTQQVRYNVEPNAQWASALEGVIKKFPIIDMITGKAVGNKELPILSKKIEGHHPEKINFYRASNDDLEGLRIMKGDILMILDTKDIQNDKIYIVEYSGRKIIRRLGKENGSIIMTRDRKGTSPEKMEPKKIKVVGKCIRVEFGLE